MHFAAGYEGEEIYQRIFKESERGRSVYYCRKSSRPQHILLLHVSTDTQLFSLQYLVELFPILVENPFFGWLDGLFRDGFFSS